MNKITATERVVKDLIFLKSLPSKEIAPGIIKRVDVEGSGETIRDIKTPCSIYLSFYKYNYEGRFIGQVLNACIRDSNKKSSPEISTGVLIAVQSMKLEQKAWFNFRHFDLHNVAGVPEDGCHFYITIQDIRYKNSDTLESKKIVSEECRKQAKILFEKKDYDKALRLYRKEINITEGLEKKKYTKQQLQQMNKIHEKAMKNFLKCFAKLSNIDENLSQAAQKYSNQLLKKYSNDEIILLLRMHVLKQRKYLTKALEMAEQLLKTTKQNANDVKLLIEELKQKIKNKNKN